MDGAADDDAVRELLCRRAEAEWLRGDVMQAVAAVESWKPRMMPTFRHGPRWVKVRLSDGSWACFETDVAGATALTGGDER